MIFINFISSQFSGRSSATDFAMDVVLPAIFLPWKTLSLAPSNPLTLSIRRYKAGIILPIVFDRTWETVKIMKG
ncbi:hypothetical protein [Microcoleus sp. CAWBG51]|uniref:hypothetical protein n=2 Tax=Microcoleus TaxID=44471 RepID=UPI0025EEE918|nr:hypothetical protein [Microcoleus sp. CAWBG51]